MYICIMYILSNAGYFMCMRDVLHVALHTQSCTVMRIHMYVGLYAAPNPCRIKCVSLRGGIRKFRRDKCIALSVK